MSTATARWVVAALSAVVIAASGYLVGSSTGLIEAAPPDADARDVDLPEASGVAGEASRVEGCVPEGCELWRIELDQDGWLWAGDGVLVDTQRLHGGLDGVGSGEMSDGVGSGEMSDGVGSGEMSDGVGSGEMEDGATDALPHASPLRIRTYASVSGELLWERSLRAVHGSWYGVDVALVFDGLVGAVTPAGLVALGADDGAERWVSEAVRGAPVAWTSVEGDLVVATEAHTEALADAEDPGPLPLDVGRQVDVTRVDRETGSVLWQVEDRRLLGIHGTNVLVTSGEAGAVALLDLADGLSRWEEAWPELGDDHYVMTSERGRVAVSGNDHVVVASLETGEVIRRSDLDPQRPGPVQLIGDVLTIGPAWPGSMEGSGAHSSSMTIVDLREQQDRVEEIEHVVGASPLYVGGWHPVGFPEVQTTGIALSLQNEDAYTVRVLDAQGEVRWERSWEVSDGDCCWELSPGIDGRSLVVIPTGDGPDPARVLSIDDGETLETLAVSGGSQRSFVWMDPVMITIDYGPHGGLRAVGPGGRFSAAGQSDAGIHGVHDDVLVISKGRTYVGLDLEMLSGGS